MAQLVQLSEWQAQIKRSEAYRYGRSRQAQGYEVVVLERKGDEALVPVVLGEPYRIGRLLREFAQVMERYYAGEDLSAFLLGLSNE